MPAAYGIGERRPRVIDIGVETVLHAHHTLATKVYFPMGTGPNDRGLSRTRCWGTSDRVPGDSLQT